MNATYQQYQSFLIHKAQANTQHGFAPLWMPDCLFDFQKYFVDWAIRQGRAALFEDCGLGKTLQQLVWGENVVRHTNKPVLLTTPLAVSGQTLAEAETFVRNRPPSEVGCRYLLTDSPVAAPRPRGRRRGRSAPCRSATD
jgi:hypothetical protein